MSGERHARVLLELARNDANACRVMAHAPDVTDAIFGVHAQQAVEKGLNALLCFHGVVYPRTHDLEELSRVLRDHKIDVPCWSEQLSGLTDCAVQYRYDFFQKNLAWNVMCRY